MTQAMPSMRVSLFLLAMTATGSVVNADSRRARHRHGYRLTEGREIQEVKFSNLGSDVRFSFSGSLDDYREQAQATAQTQSEPTPMPSPGPTQTPETGAPVVSPTTIPTAIDNNAHPSASPSVTSASPALDSSGASAAPSIVSSTAPSASNPSSTSPSLTSASPTLDAIGVSTAPSVVSSTAPSASNPSSTAPSVTSASPTLDSVGVSAAPSIVLSTAPSAVEQSSSAPSSVLSSAPSAGESFTPSVAPSIISSTGGSLSPTASAVPSSSPTGSASPSVSVISSAPSMSPTQIGDVGGASSVDDDPTLIMCSDTPAGSEQVIYRYALETKPGYDATEMMMIVEDALNLHLASKLLPCLAHDGGNRRLEIDIDLNGLDSLPVDKPDFDAFCTPNADVQNNVCTVLDGDMTVYYKAGADMELIRYHVLLETSEFLSGLRLPGIASSFFLGPSIDDPSRVDTSPNGSDGGGGDTLSSGRAVESSSILLITLGGVSLACFVGVAVYLVQTRRGAPAANGSDILDKDDTAIGDIEIPQVHTADTELGLEGDLQSEASPLSPFSAMLPNAYRFDDDLSIILETQSNATRNSDNILISEGGYSTSDESSFSLHSSVNQSNLTATPVLGARRRKDESLLFPL